MNSTEFKNKVKEIKGFLTGKSITVEFSHNGIVKKIDCKNLNHFGNVILELEKLGARFNFSSVENKFAMRFISNEKTLTKWMNRGVWDKVTVSATTVKWETVPATTEEPIKQDNMKSTEKTKTTFRAKVFRYAWQIVRNTGKSFSIALVKAWQVYKLRKRMATDTVKFAFEKADGSLRVAYGTLKNAVVKGTGKENYKTVAYFDTEKNAFRCFRVENLIRIY